MVAPATSFWLCSEDRMSASPPNLARRFSVALLLLGLVVCVQASAAVLEPPPVPESASAEGGFEDGVARVRARLLVGPPSQLDPGGTALQVGVLFDLDPEWHIYWKNPGESGLPTRLSWDVGDAVLSPLRWPVPRSYRESDGLFTTYGYSKQVLVAGDLGFRRAEGTRRIGVEVSALACKRECIPVELSLSRMENPGEWLVDSPEAHAAKGLFDHYAALAPVSPESVGVELQALYSQTPIRPDDVFEAAIRVSCPPQASPMAGPRCPELLEAAASATFFPEAADLMELSPKGVRLSPSGASEFALLFAGEGLAAESLPTAQGAGEARLTGVMRIEGPAGRVSALEVDLPYPRGREGAEVSSLGADWLEGPGLESAAPASVAQPVSVGFGYALVLAFLGGLLLNLMPCVLPVLAIKVFAVAELAQRSRRELLGHGFAYTAGVLATMLLLALVVVALRAGGSSVGWGFQFQEPLFVAVVSTVVVGFALNLFGVFEVSLDAGALSRLGHQASGMRRSFFDGLLGVVLATPCSAPFLGTAVGFAFASSGPRIVAVFLAIGLGLAAPFALISLVPGVAKWVPRPGEWMLKLRAGLGFALLATAVWLLWVYGRSAGVDGMVSLIGVLVAFSFGLWLFGVAQSAGKARLAPTLALALLIATVLGLHSLDPEPVDRAGESGGDVLASSRFDRERVSEELREGRPVFVYFTADWCITCKVNERVVLADPAIRDELNRLRVASFKGDWTHRDETIRAELARFGKAGVPLYLVYDPDRPEEPVILPEVLTVQLLLEALREVSSAAVSTARL